MLEARDLAQALAEFPLVDRNIDGLSGHASLHGCQRHGRIIIPGQLRKPMKAPKPLGLREGLHGADLRLGFRVIQQPDQRGQGQVLAMNHRFLFVKPVPKEFSGLALDDGSIVIKQR